MTLVQAMPALARSYDDVVASKFIEIAVYKDFPPYSYRDPQGAEKGIDVELAQHIAKEMNLDLRLRWITPDETLDDDLRNHVWKGHYLGGGIADVMMRVPYDREYSFQTDEFGQVKNDLVHMFAPYQKERWRVGFDQDQIESLETLAVLRYYPVGVETDSLPDIYLLSVFNGQMRNQVKHFPDLMAAFEALSQKEVAALMGMQGQLQWLQVQHPEQKFQLATVALQGLHKLDWDIGLAVHNNYRQLAYALGDVVEAAAKNGVIEKINQKYGVSYLLPDLYKTTQ
ncbi:hypothetical protein BTE48_07945 [Oceanospirillum multiglobuliferum]|uniref:Solute-binding protein family 3/N-terminal domain-containing protein n=2 Tax=Oceanospirillum multiglobuliferum TaxID=64969 RepID=A0A1V4T4W6_9GAMM|nr:hypothetical protein BTE48_07945 [Oceanospirillum multiglobuliferum]